MRDLLGATDVAIAYAVQDEVSRRRRARGGAIVGREIGLTSSAVQEQLGVDQPDFGVLFADMAYADGPDVPMGSLLQPKFEAEVAFIPGKDLDGDLDLAAVSEAVAHAVAALEIVDSRVAGWDITILDTAADTGSSGLFVLGSTPQSLDEFEPKYATS